MNLVLVSLTLAVVWMVNRETQSRLILIAPIHVPESMEKKGYSAAVVSKRIGSRLREIDEGSASVMRRDKLAGQSEQIDIQIPGVGINYRSIVRFAKEMIGLNDTLVTGDLIQNGGNLVMHIQINLASGGVRSIEVHDDSGTEESIARKSAEEIMRVIRPYVLGSYYFQTAFAKCNREKQCDFAMADSVFRQILDAPDVGDHHWAWLGLGNTLSAMRRYEDAIETYRKATDSNRKFSLAFLNWGSALFSLNRNKEAIEQFRRAIVLDPRSALAYNSLGYALFKSGRHEESFRMFKQATDLNPKLSLAYVNWGDALAALNLTVVAIDKYRIAISIDPRDYRAHNNWGNVLFKMALYPEAIEHYQRATDLDPTQSLALQNWCEVMKRLDPDHEAITMSSRAKGIGPG
ncbi:MAG: tetratricopeptide repeat protein [Burkholderiaceae bacterium]|nr:tetratricopeptide repeat protein [Rhodoferax sp.]